MFIIMYYYFYIIQALLNLVTDKELVNNVIKEQFTEKCAVITHFCVPNLCYLLSFMKHKRKFTLNSFPYNEAEW